MVSFISLLGVVALLLLSLTRQRILIICAFYACYGFLTVLGEGRVPELGGLSIYWIFYLILLLSIAVRASQDNQFLLYIRRWPLASFFVLLFVTAFSSLYSPSSTVLLLNDPSGLFARVVILSLFCIAAAHVQQESDLQMFAATTVIVSLAASGWVVWTAAEADFAAYRGGVLVNENYVSLLILMGAIPVIYGIFVQRSYLLSFSLLIPLFCMVVASLILASRGTIIATVVSIVVMVVGLIRSIGRPKIVLLAMAVVLICCVGMLMPGGNNLAVRLGASDVSTLDERTSIWSHSLDYFASNGLTGMVFGGGLSSSARVIGRMLPENDNYQNMYLLWLMEQGVAGLIAFVIFVYFIARISLKSHHPLKNVMISWLAYFLVVGLTNTVSNDRVFWIVLGVVMGASTLANKSISASRHAVEELHNIPLAASSNLRTAEEL